jgi:hypothetical protein
VDHDLGDVPAEVLGAARRAFQAPSGAGELAELTHDSVSAEQPDPKSDSSHRQLTFVAPSLMIKVLIAGSAGQGRFEGTIDPPRPGTLTACGPESVLGTVTLDGGAFVLAPAPEGVMSLQVEFADGSAVHTDWFVA